MEHNIQSGPPRDPNLQAALGASPLQPGPPLPPPLPVAPFPSRPYAPDGACPGAGFPVLGLTLMAGVGVAIVVGLLRQWIYLVFLFPVPRRNIPRIPARIGFPRRVQSE